MTIFLTALVTLVVTVLAGVALDYIRHGRPKVAYSVEDAVPIALEGKSLGAYLVSLSNPSKRVVRDVTCHIQAPPATLRNGGITTSQGLQYSVTEGDKRIELSIPYLRRGDELRATVIAEGYYVPKTPDVAIRSPQDVTITLEYAIRPRPLQIGFFTAALVASVVASATVALRFTTVPFETQKDVLTFAAATAGLPHLADLYATAADVAYYDQGDLAYAWAAASADPVEIEKYRRLLSVILESDSRMMSASRANLYYSRGKIDLLLADNNRALQDFREAIARSKSTVDAKSKVEPKIREFVAHDLL